MMLCKDVVQKYMMLCEDVVQDVVRKCCAEPVIRTSIRYYSTFRNKSPQLLLLECCTNQNYVVQDVDPKCCANEKYVVRDVDPKCYTNGNYVVRD